MVGPDMEDAITFEEVLAACRRILEFGPWYWVPVTVFLAGFLGSFVNVCIWRIPRGESLGFQRSRCTTCGTALEVLDLLPVISYVVVMRGRCRHCRAPVPRRYVMVEIWVIAFWLGAYALHGPGAKMLLTGTVLTAVFTIYQIRKMRDQGSSDSLSDTGPVA